MRCLLDTNIYCFTFCTIARTKTLQNNLLIVHTARRIGAIVITENTASTSSDPMCHTARSA